MLIGLAYAVQQVLSEFHIPGGPSKYETPTWRDDLRVVRQKAIRFTAARG